MSDLCFWIIELTLGLNIFLTVMLYESLASLSDYELEENG